VFFFDKYCKREKNGGVVAFFQRRETETPRDPREEHLVKMRDAARVAGLPIHAEAAVEKELSRLEQTDPNVAEYSIGLNYLECVLSLPWNVSTPDNLDLGHAQMILDEEHYGLARVKDRVLEYLASRIMIGRQPSKILVVDDEEVARANLTRVFAKQGYRADSAANGIEALKLAETGHYDLILTDLKMDKMDGLTLLEKVKSISPATEVALITGFATVDTAVTAFKKGAVHYFAKPVNLDDLRADVAAILDAKRRVSLSRGPILCFAGPPGTGKTSIGRSIARAMGREFVRFSLAGLRDEAELRGHRRTYAGSLPGRIIGELRRCGYNNPVFMLDEMDKIGQDFRGDPASVLLEVLDPEQNARYLDHFLDIPFDLSSVMFIATANIAERLPRPLLDRLEIIPYASYTLAEKRHIARRHLLPRQIEANGLPHEHVAFSDGALDAVIADYTREAGLRNLERELASICRRLDRIILSGAASLPLTVDEQFARTLLGPPKFAHEAAGEKNKAGVATGLVWTEYGGEIIFVESVRMKGRGELILTGSLGEVLRESAQAALSYVRAHAGDFGIDPDFFSGQDIHVHIPGGAVPKDGPSAGATIALALVSLLSKRPARRTTAMSGEITLTGEILSVGGVREKILAASRAGVKTVVLPERNRRDVEALEADALEGVKVEFVGSLEELAKLALA
jgi:ATP-dependent Lon protease